MIKRLPSFYMVMGNALLVLCLFSSCTPKVEVHAPREPITINLNVKIEHELKVKVDKDLDEVFAKDSELF